MKKEMFYYRKLNLLLIIFLLCSQSVFCNSDSKRDVPFTKELYDFIDFYFNYQTKEEENLNYFFSEACGSVSTFQDEYSAIVHNGRCFYFYGLSLMNDYDISDISKTNLNDTKEKKVRYKQASRYFDLTIDMAKQALKIKKGSDAYTLLCQGISANCTAKNSSYIISSGPKVNTYAKKALNIDPLNGTALYLGNCQNIYAPAPFCNLKEGKNKMIRYLQDSDLTMEKFDIFYMYAALGFCCQRQGLINEATDWYEKAFLIYPENISVNRFISKIKEKD